ncbi:MAG: hypothetical protein JM58_11235 [Peptococcaceae bacterium BICA1-8]|nr:MAG: hypothetical protein JM58_11235 [Peptococcaceae bacterium BICA1-8]
MGWEFGVRKKYLEIDLSNGKICIFEFPESYYGKFLGGKAFNAKFLLDAKLYNCEPLSEENQIILSVGPVTGTTTPGVGKAIFSTRSPLTGGYLDSTIGGSLGHNIKLSGYDGIIIKGKSEKPVFLEITNDKATLHDASELWGKGCFDSEKLLREKYGTKYSVAVIGPGGENLVPYAVVHADFYHQAGRGGVGAVLGSKNLKGLVVFGNQEVPLYDSKAHYAKTLEIIKKFHQDPGVKFRIKYGTMSTLDLTQHFGIVSVKNFTEGITEAYETNMNRDYFRENYISRDLGCLGCSMPCGKAATVDFNNQQHRVGGPEYETISVIGTNLEVGPSETLYFNWLCDDLGIDTVSAGNVVAYVVEALEDGKLSKNDVGYELKWGSSKNVERAMQDIAYIRDFGKYMALGVKKLAEELGLDSGKAIHVKGMELPGYDPRGSTGYALGYAVADRGGCHRRARPTRKEQENEEFRFAYQGKGEFMKEQEDIRAFYHSLIICDFVPPRYKMKIKDYAEYITLITGMEFDKDEAIRVSERAFTLARVFNLKCGLTARDDVLPQRFYKEPMKKGNADGKLISWDGFLVMREEYYRARGWDAEGIPTQKTLERLGIGGIVL